MTLVPVNMQGERNRIAVDRGSVELVLTEDVGSHLSMILVPLEDLKEIETKREFSFSLSLAAESAWGGLSGAFEKEREKLARKSIEFGDSKTFLNRLANLARLSGNLDLEGQYIQQARALSDDVFFDHRWGEHLLSRGERKEAEILYTRLSERSDVKANLRMAYFHVQRRDLSAACESIARAVDTDPLNFAARLFEGALYMAQGNYIDAVRSFRIAGDEKPNSSVLHSNLAIAYIYLNVKDKAATALRRSIALDPLNRTAVILLADLAFEQGNNEDAVPALRYFAEMEQADASVWARLARGLLEIGSVDESIIALKRQASVEDSPSVWNNLGVAYYRKGGQFKRKAYEAFKHALRSELVKDDHSYLLASKNLCALLYEDGDYKSMGDLVDAILYQPRAEAILADRELSDFAVLRIAAYEQVGKSRDAASLALELANNGSGIARNLTAWTAAWALAYATFEKQPQALIRSLVDHFLPLADQLTDIDIVRRNALINNIAFALIEIGSLDEADRLLQRLSDRVHKDPYPTATLGLLHLKRGRLEKGKFLYDEAVRLAVSDQDKRRIRQKLNLELALYWMPLNNNNALKYLDRVVAEKRGVSQISSQATTLRRILLAE